MYDQLIMKPIPEYRAQITMITLGFLCVNQTNYQAYLINSSAVIRIYYRSSKIT